MGLPADEDLVSTRHLRDAHLDAGPQNLILDVRSFEWAVGG